jgi:transposase
MVGPYELTDAQWARIARLLPGKPGDPGRRGVDNRQFVNAVLVVVRTGQLWARLPKRYGNHKTVHKRFTRWVKAGVWKKVFGVLVGDRDNPYLGIDTLTVRYHLKPQGSKIRLW